MSKPILLFLCINLFAHAELLAQSTGLRWNEPDSVVLYNGPGAELVLQFTVTNNGAKTETMDVRIEGDTASWKVVRTERGYADDIVMMPAEKVWVDVTLTGPLTSSSSAQLIADGSLTADTLQLTGIAMYNGVAWKPDVFAFTLRANQTSATLYRPLYNMWHGEVTVVDLVLEGDEAWSINQALPLRLAPGSNRDIAIEFSPSSPGTYSARLIAKTVGISDTLLITGTLPKARGAHWDKDTVLFSPTFCMATISQVVELNNDGSSDVEIANVSIVGLDASFFRIISTSPPGKLQNFVLSPAPPGNGVRYLIEFDPKGSTQPHVAELIAHTSNGISHKMTLIGIVQRANVIDVDTTFKNLKVGVDHTFTLQVSNTGEMPFQVSSINWTGELDANLEGLASGNVLAPGSIKDVTVVLRSTDAGSKSKAFQFNGGECDDRFEVRINAQFGDQSAVSDGASSYPALAQVGHFVLVKHAEPGALPYYILDLTGRVIKSGKSSQTESIDLSSLSMGAYVFVLGEDNIHYLKFLKR